MGIITTHTLAIGIAINGRGSGITGPDNIFKIIENHIAYSGDPRATRHVIETSSNKVLNLIGEEKAAKALQERAAKKLK